jgi:hypothetical protein
LRLPFAPVASPERTLHHTYSSPQAYLRLMRDIAAATMPPLTRRQSARHADRPPKADQDDKTGSAAHITSNLLGLPRELQDTILGYVREVSLRLSWYMPR